MTLHGIGYGWCAYGMNTVLAERFAVRWSPVRREVSVSLLDVRRLEGATVQPTWRKIRFVYV